MTLTPFIWGRIMAGGMGWGMLGSAEPQLGECFSLTACHAGGSGGFDGDAELGLSVPGGGGRGGG